MIHEVNHDEAIDDLISSVYGTSKIAPVKLGKITDVTHGMLGDSLMGVFSALALLMSLP